MDEIRIERLKVYAHHGYYADEKWNGQHFEVSAVLKLPLQNAGMTDALADTVDYASVCEFIAAKMTEKTVDLIETVAEYLADSILNRYETVRSVEIEVRKPEAPISLEVSCVSVKVARSRHIAYVAFGSNMGDSKALIGQAIDLVEQDDHCKVLAVSEIIKSTPYGGVDQADFYNGVMEVETFYEPMSLLNCLLAIEKKLGRTRKVHWGPRTIDLDILLFDQMVIDSKELVIPHPDMKNRDFVLKPLSELAPYLRHPLLYKTVKELLEEVQEVHVAENAVKAQAKPSANQTVQTAGKAPRVQESYIYRGKNILKRSP